MPDYKKMKDESNKRIMEVISILATKMAEENRGFIFAPIAQLDGNHRTMCAVVFPNKEQISDLGADEFMRFWASMASIVANFNSQLSEEQRKAFKQGFIPFCKGVTEQAFPKIKFIDLN